MADAVGLFGGGGLPFIYRLREHICLLNNGSPPPPLCKELKLRCRAHIEQFKKEPFLEFVLENEKPIPIPSLKNCRRVGITKIACPIEPTR